MNIDKGQHFQACHYAAFNQPKPDLDDPDTQRERMSVQDKLLELGEEIWPFIQRKQWDLHRHRQKQHYTSSHHFIFSEGRPIVNRITSMWLHYGKSARQLDSLKTLGGNDYRSLDVDDFYNAFYLHTRIQVYINSTEVRCWLLLATDKNYYDRSEFLGSIRRDSLFREKVWSAVKPILGKGFFYEIDSTRLDLDTDLKEDGFFKFVKTDRGGMYSGIVKAYLPNDPKISAMNIGLEMQNNFELLYPIYDLMAYRMMVPTYPEPTASDMSQLFGGEAKVR